ncbi:hypothetical protein PAAL109150_15850 [Paenibacillus alkaliterrae]
MDIPPLGAAPFAAGSYQATGTGVGGGPTGFVAGAHYSDEGPGTKGVLQDIGVPEKFAKECEEAVEAGHYLLISEVDSEDEAATLFLQAGASNVFL